MPRSTKIAAVTEARLLMGTAADHASCHRSTSDHWQPVGKFLAAFWASSCGCRASWGSRRGGGGWTYSVRMAKKSVLLAGNCICLSLRSRGHLMAVDLGRALGLQMRRPLQLHLPLRRAKEERICRAGSTASARGSCRQHRTHRSHALVAAAAAPCEGLCAGSHGWMV